MSGFVCPKCKTETQIFAPTTGGARAMCQQMNVPFLGSIPLDPLLAKSCDQGKDFSVQAPQSIAAISFQSIFKGVVASLDQSDQTMQ